MRTLILAAAGVAFAGLAHAQNSIVFTMDGDEFFLDAAGGLIGAGELRPDEVGIVTPSAPGPYSASIFLTAEAQFVYLGDADDDGRVIDASTDGPGQDTNAVFVKRFTGAPAGEVGPRDLYYSKEGDADFGPTFQDGDVFRYIDQCNLDVFVTEDMITDGIGQGVGGDIDIDAICQDENGNIFFSMDLTETVVTANLGSLSVEDGSILMFPVAAVTYDGSGNVTAIAVDSAVLVADEDDVIAFMVASGVMTSVGGAPSTSVELSGLDVDPSGGTFTAPQTGAGVLPNLLFTWDGFSNDGAILSTAGGGSIAVINGVPIGSPIFTFGDQIGLLPDSTGLGGIAGLAIIPQRDDPLTSENYPVNLITSSTILFHQQEISGATANGLVIGFATFSPVTLPGPSGNFCPPSVMLAFGEFFTGPSTIVLLEVAVADAGGHAVIGRTLPLQAFAMGRHLIFQVLDFTTFMNGGTALGAPAGLQYL